MMKGYRWKERRVVRLRVDPESMGQLMITNGAYRVVSGVPVDARCLGAHVDPLSGNLWLQFESEEFEPVSEGGVIPELPPSSVQINIIPEDMLWAALKAQAEHDYDTDKEVSEIVDKPCVTT